MSEILKDGVLYATVLKYSDYDYGIRWFGEQHDSLQVASWRLHTPHSFTPHRHIKNRRMVDRTQEMIVVLRGSMKITIYDDKGQHIDEVEIGELDAIILWRGGHKVEVLEDITSAYEIKNGPYIGRDKDKVNI